MLISMPTGTSTIFGVFQVIRVSQVFWRDFSRQSEGKATSDIAQVFTLWLCIAQALRRTYSTFLNTDLTNVEFASANQKIATDASIFSRYFALRTTSAAAIAPVPQRYSIPSHPGFRPCPDLPH
jgi:hypothetical protein